MLWYVLERYVHCLLGRTHLSTSDVTSTAAVGMFSLQDRPHVHLTQQELHGLKVIKLTHY